MSKEFNHFSPFPRQRSMNNMPWDSRSPLDGIKSNDRSNGMKYFSSNKMNQKSWSMSNRSRRVRGPIIPKKGDPGSMDDIRRKGLSGAGVRWYLRYLQQGFAPDVARQKAGEHRTKPERPDSYKPANLRGTKSNDKDTQDSHIVSVTVLHKRYPYEKLSEDESVVLEEAIVDEIAKGGERKLQFDSVHYEDGRLIVECDNKGTASWLLEVSSKLGSWKGSEITAFLEDDFAKRHSIFLFLPHSAGQDHSKSLALIDAQNSKIDIDLWHILESRDEDDNQVLAISIDDKSYETTKKIGNVLRYRFGKVYIGDLNSENSAENENDNNDVEDVDGMEDVEQIGERGSQDENELIELDD